jgi:hypothetical protein
MWLKEFKGKKLYVDYFNQRTIGPAKREREREESWGVIVRDTTVWKGV